jgi:protein-tyrosine phosphatase
MFETILLVCEANMCRSPMAQVILADRLPGATVISAGVRARPGRPADEAAVELMNARGYDLRSHSTRSLEFDQVRAARLILTMTLEQRITVERFFPFARGKVYRLGEHGNFDVADPYRASLARYEASLVQIETGIGNWIQGIRKCG